VALLPFVHRRHNIEGDMSNVSLFRHQDYTATRPVVPLHLLRPETPPPIGSNDFRHRMRRVADALRKARVGAIYLVHGTFNEADTLGILTDLARVFPSASKAVRGVIRRIAQKMAGGAGNFTPNYARYFEESLEDARQPHASCPEIPVRLFPWSAENHHIGRADGAIRLIDELASLDLEPGKRVLLWGHSHAGNVFALMSNLLAGKPQAIERFFDAAAIYYRWPLFGCIDIPVWARVRRLLTQDKGAFDASALDLVTFGTPIRYGWNREGYARLLHFIHHRPAPGTPEYRAPFPPKFNDIMTAASGDYVQQLGIAGTNVLPSRFAWRARMADQRLNDILQGEKPEIGDSHSFTAGAIVPDEGTALLVDYGLPGGHIAQHLAGHAVYTRKRWLLFHAEEVARRMYGNAPTAA